MAKRNSRNRTARQLLEQYKPGTITKFGIVAKCYTASDTVMSGSRGVGCAVFVELEGSSRQYRPYEFES